MHHFGHFRHFFDFLPKLEDFQNLPLHQENQQNQQYFVLGQQQLNIDNKVQSEIAGLQKQYGDFNHFANKAADLVEQRNQAGFKLSIEDAYKLARAENPDMVNEFQNSQPTPSLAGGLLPTSRLIGDPSSGSSDLDFDQAAERAFQEEVVNEGLSGLFATEDSTSHSPPLKE